MLSGTTRIRRRLRRGDVHLAVVRLHAPGLTGAVAALAQLTAQRSGELNAVGDEGRAGADQQLLLPGKAIGPVLARLGRDRVAVEQRTDRRVDRGLYELPGDGDDRALAARQCHRPRSVARGVGGGDRAAPRVERGRPRPAQAV